MTTAIRLLSDDDLQKIWELRWWVDWTNQPDWDMVFDCVPSDIFEGTYAQWTDTIRAVVDVLISRMIHIMEGVDSAHVVAVGHPDDTRILTMRLPPSAAKFRDASIGGVPFRVKTWEATLAWPVTIIPNTATKRGEIVVSAIPHQGAPKTRGRIRVLNNPHW